MPEQRSMTQTEIPSLDPLAPDLLAGLLDEMEREQAQRQQSPRQSPFMLIPNFKGSIKRGDKPRQYPHQKDHTT
jgi:hypothetical protein